MWLISELGRRHTSELWSPHRDDTSSFYDAVTRDLWLGWATLQRRSCVRFAAAEKHTRLSSLSSLVNDWRVAALPATEQPQMVYVCRSKPQSDATCGGDPRLLATVARSCTWKGSSNETWEATSPLWRAVTAWRPHVARVPAALLTLLINAIQGQWLLVTGSRKIGNLCYRWLNATYVGLPWYRSKTLATLWNARIFSLLNSHVHDHRV